MRLLALAFLICAGCATGYTRASSSEGYGYYDEQLVPGEWLVIYRADVFTDTPRALELWHRRAAELALQSNCTSYDAVDLQITPRSQVPDIVRASVLGRVRCVR
jgi:hypothetical protein